MLFYADLHIHSKYSRATSKDCTLEELAKWAQKKGLSVISTGDFTHPQWFSEIKEKLVEENPGIYRLKPEIEQKIFNNNFNIIRFILSVEISTIYKKWDKTRKVHHVVFMPNIESASIFREKLASIGNINSDGRPILGLDSRNLLEVVLESNQNGFIIPAHIWTPWFSALGSKSGFDSIDDCYGDLKDHIFAVETGLSSDPQMNYRVSSLDKYRLVSNSDAHSPSKLARECTVFNTEKDYFSIKNAMKNGEGYIGTVEFFPQEGKYHENGHRKCNVCLNYEDTIKYNGICPVCNKPLTIGVSHRVNELSDKPINNFPLPKTHGKTFSLVPLVEILSEILNLGPSSKKVQSEYDFLINKLGPELNILQEIPIEDISKSYSDTLAEAVLRLRNGKVIKHPGFDGEYGVIKLFEENELNKKKVYNLKLDLKINSEKKQNISLNSNNSQGFLNQNDIKNPPSINSQGFLNQNNIKNQKYELDEFQKKAVEDSCDKIIIIAGPGSGKTTVLTQRIYHNIKNENVKCENCLAITFTNKAAEEMKSRLKKIIPSMYKNINIHTFHSLCLSILKNNFEKAGLNKDFQIITEKEKLLYKEIENKSNIVSFDDLINITINLFVNNPNILSLYQEKFKFIAIDEYQDINQSQYDLIKLLITNETKLYAIGDPNQAIYGFRGGDSKFFNNFTNDFNNAKIINLKNNYRSNNTIVNASNQMIECFNIISRNNNTQNDKIKIHSSTSDKQEAQFVIKTIEELIGGHSFFSLDTNRSEGQITDYSFSDFAILYRTSSQLEPIICALKNSSMPYAKYSNDLICDKKEIRNLLYQLNDKENIDIQLADLTQNYKDKIEDYILTYLINFSKKYNTKSEFLHNVSLLKESDTYYKDSQRISLMTLHSSKGLEFRCVFIVGVENGILPLYRAKTNEEKEEERRLFYVGMTRAKDKLFLSYAKKRKWFGTYKNFEPSDFLKKIEEDLLMFSKYKNTKKIKKDDEKQLTLF